MGRTSDAKDRLMEAIRALMWEGSYGSVTIDDICTRAGVKKGSFYHFFESKVDLAIAALEDLWLTRWKPIYDQKFSATVDPLERMTSYIDFAFESQCELREETGKMLGCPLCSVGSEVSTYEPKLAAKIRDLLARKRRYWVSAIRDAVATGAIPPCDPEQKALSLGALIDGTVAQARIMNDPEIMRPLPQMMLDFLRAKVPAER